MAGALLYQLALNVVSQITSFDSEEALLRVGFCKIGASLHAGHDSDGAVVRNAEDGSNILRRTEMIGFDLDGTEAFLPDLRFFVESSDQLIVDVTPDLRQIRLTAPMRVHARDGMRYT